MKFKDKLHFFIRDEKGLSIAEYGLILAATGLMILGTFAIAGKDITDAFDKGLTPVLSERLAGLKER